MHNYKNIFGNKSWFYMLPFVLTLSIPMFIYSTHREESRYFFASLFTVIIPLLLFRVSQLKPFYFVLLSFPVLLLSIGFDTTALDFDAYINIGVWTAIFDTYYAESVELISDTRLITKLLVGFQIFIYFSYLFHSYKKQKTPINKKTKWIILSLLFIFCIDYISKGATRISFPFRDLGALVTYKKQKIYEKQFFSERDQKDVNASQNKEFFNDTKETMIVVVGESLRRDHLGYYGYQKPTTPKMEKEDLIIFTDAISPTNQTVNSLKRDFSAADYENDSAYYKEPSFIKSFNETGFETYWLSTQRMYGEHDSEVSFIAKECDSIVFRNSFSYDDVLIQHLKEILTLDAPKKLILIHILGSHTSYKKRYPPSFNKFEKKQYQDKKKQYIDQYDNSVLYNDYVLSEFLSVLKEEKGNNVFIMFSDHGESLFQSGPNRMAHSSEDPAKCEFGVPLIVWFSKMYKQNHPDKVQTVENNRKLPVNLSDLYHSISSIYGIQFSNIKPEKNFFGTKYVPLTHRRVMNSTFNFTEYNTLKNSYLDDY